MTKKEITELYRSWRKQNKNHHPNRAVVRMYWEDGDNTEKGYQEDTVALEDFHVLSLPPDDHKILFYAGNLEGLLQLRKPNNGSGFVVTDVIEFYRYAYAE